MSRHLRVASRWRRLIWPAAAVGVVAVLAFGAALTAGVFSGPTAGQAATLGSPGSPGSPNAASPATTTSAGPTALAPTTTRTVTSAGPTTGPAKAPAASGPAHFTTLAVNAILPTGGQCATWVRGATYKENKGSNAAANRATGHHIGTDIFGGDASQAQSVIAPRIDGQFTGTTHQILRWAACKWGIDEDIVYAQAAVESWWRQDTRGDWSNSAAVCAPGRGLGVDGTAGQCPESYGILQNRYQYEKSGWPGFADSTAMNADLAYGIWRACYQGYEGWLNTVPEIVGTYAAGDAWGCVGRWFSGRWHTPPAETYLTKVHDYLNQRIWETPNFQQP